ncbi:MAG: hypothetical protein KatS3mg023_3744 [Armatimonadota bacterium]|nr:MAG: hypothetical protein KatS3mg023_3744 [Armatimonadota bacterium]
MNSPAISEYQCPNPNCKQGKDRNRYLYMPNLPFERIEYVQIDQFGNEISSRVVYRCRYCGTEFTVQR